MIRFPHLLSALIRFPRMAGLWMLVMLGMPPTMLHADLEWGRLPELPAPIGLAAPFAGVAGESLVVAGGANFPTAPPWEGGTKAWHDKVFVLENPSGTWREAGCLPRPLAYGVSVTTPRGVLCVGGSDSDRHYADCFLLRFEGGQVITEPMPVLPRPLANMAGALIGNKIYMIGGTHAPADTTASNALLVLDLSQLEQGWKQSATFPGLGRILPVVGTKAGALYVLSGASLAADAAGKPVRTYLRDAWRLDAGGAWTRLADLPRAAVAAPSPAPTVGESHLFVIGGDDGTKVDFEPKSAHPGFSREILGYDTVTGTWTGFGELPDGMSSPVTAPVVCWGDRLVIPSGEIRPAVRTPQVLTCQARSTKVSFERVNRLVVEAGKPVDARFVGKPWDTAADGLTAEGTGRFLYAHHGLGEGDFRIAARLVLARADGSAASFVMDGSNFGFDGRNGGLFAEGAIFEGIKPRSGARVVAGVPFDFEIVRKDGLTRILIDGKELLRKERWNGAVGRIGLRPWRNQMTVKSFEVAGNLVAPAQPPEPLFLSGFAGGKDGYHTYRIPALTVTRNGSVLAFCEGRKNSWGDSGDIDLLVKRSTDNGKTWSKQQVIWDDGSNCCGNPCVVVDRETGTIFLLSTWNRGDDHEGEIIARKSKDTRRVFVLQSTDDGLTWSKPQEITGTAKKPDWTWYATGPGSGIQIENGPHKGRLVIPCDHIEAETKRYYSHIIFSDDHGKTWQLGGRTPQHQVNECEVVELTSGRLMLNMRNYNRANRTRQTAVSEDGGLTWRDQTHDAALIEPICQAAIERLGWPQGSNPGVVVFSNPASATGRVNLTLRASFDDARTWPLSKVLWPGPSGYSDLAVLSNNAIACLYEGGAENIAESIIFAAIDPDLLSKDSSENK